MEDFKRCLSVRLLGLIGVLTTTACSTSGGVSASKTFAPETAPTMSLEAIAINGVSLGARRKVQINASPGDIITAEVYIRDWSPYGERLSGFQASLLADSFASGKGGLIEPVQYDALQKTGEENPDNSFVDQNHPRYVHKGRKTLALADTRSEGYRWMSIMLKGKAPKCAQDGRRFYCATIKFEVSKNAEGTFTLELNSHPDFSGLRKADAAPIHGVKFEPLTIKILGDEQYRSDGDAVSPANTTVEAQMPRIATARPKFRALARLVLH